LILVQGNCVVLEVRVIRSEECPVEDLKKGINGVSDLLKENADNISHFMKNCEDIGYQLILNK